ncbi:hypothetical protein BDF20DRAFT_851752 [Mycotypha africana]|uniref:uncharacterized protein n=1 Tax=Mycotypha africana TaxID=64632 RepID=UPI002301AF31|nr:uncharacterized protein BDF20DRAFT_851752 [Mycotypha africana]KAI8987700.1 hypothetical protein BDF20DRAFT_851752 [Mycotypha africana]
MSSTVIDQTLIEAFHHIRFDADSTTTNNPANTTNSLPRGDSYRPRSRNTQCVPSEDEEDEDEQDVYQSSDNEEDEVLEEAFEKARLKANFNNKTKKLVNEVATNKRSKVPLPSDDEVSTDDELEDHEEDEEEDDDDDNDILLSVKLNNTLNKNRSLQLAAPQLVSNGLNLMLPFNKSAPTLAQQAYQTQPQKPQQQRHSSDSSHYKQINYHHTAAVTNSSSSIPQIMLGNRSISTEDLSRYNIYGNRGISSGSNSSSHSRRGGGGAEGGDGGEEDHTLTSRQQIASSAASSSSHSSPKMHLSMQQQQHSFYPSHYFQHHHHHHHPNGTTSTNTSATPQLQQQKKHHQHYQHHQQQMRALSGMDLIKQREQEKADAKRQNNKLPRLMNPAQMEAKFEGGLLSRLPQQGTHNINFQQVQQQHEEQMKKYKKEQQQFQQQMAAATQQQQMLLGNDSYPLYDYYYQQQPPTMSITAGNGNGLYQMPYMNNSNGNTYMMSPSPQQAFSMNSRPGSELPSNNQQYHSSYQYHQQQRSTTPVATSFYSQYH